MVVVLPKHKLRKAQIKRRKKTQTDKYIGRGFFKILETDLVHEFNQRYTYILSQQARNVWRYFVFCGEYLMYTERCQDIHVANQKAHDYILSLMANEQPTTLAMEFA